MPNCNFYSAREDHKLILEHLLSGRECNIYDLSSEPGKEVVHYRKLEDFQVVFGFEDWSNAPSMLLQLYPTAAGGIIDFRRLNLSNAATPNVSFRFKTMGWGLVQLYLYSPHNDSLRPSYTNHNSEQRALNCRVTFDDEMGHPDAWDWKEVSSFSRRLNYFIRKNAVAKERHLPILPCAFEARQRGVTF